MEILLIGGPKHGETIESFSPVTISLGETQYDTSDLLGPVDVFATYVVEKTVDGKFYGIYTLSEILKSNSDKNV